MWKNIKYNPLKTAKDKKRFKKQVLDNVDDYLGEYIKERAIKKGETTTTVIKSRDSWKMLVKYLN